MEQAKTTTTVATPTVAKDNKDTKDTKDTKNTKNTKDTKMHKKICVEFIEYELETFLVIKDEDPNMIYVKLYNLLKLIWWNKNELADIGIHMCTKLRSSPGSIILEELSFNGDACQIVDIISDYMKTSTVGDNYLVLKVSLIPLTLTHHNTHIYLENHILDILRDANHLKERGTPVKHTRNIHYTPQGIPLNKVKIPIQCTSDNCQNILNLAHSGSGMCGDCHKKHPCFNDMLMEEAIDLVQKLEAPCKKEECKGSVYWNAPQDKNSESSCESCGCEYVYSNYVYPTDGYIKTWFHNIQSVTKLTMKISYYKPIKNLLKDFANFSFIEMYNLIKTFVGEYNKIQEEKKKKQSCVKKTQTDLESELELTYLEAKTRECELKLDLDVNSNKSKHTLDEDMAVLEQLNKSGSGISLELSKKVYEESVIPYYIYGINNIRELKKILKLPTDYEVFLFIEIEEIHGLYHVLIGIEPNPILSMYFRVVDISPHNLTLIQRDGYIHPRMMKYSTDVKYDRKATHPIYKYNKDNKDEGLNIYGIFDTSKIVFSIHINNDYIRYNDYNHYIYWCKDHVCSLLCDMWKYLSSGNNIKGCCLEFLDGYYMKKCGCIFTPLSSSINIYIMNGSLYIYLYGCNNHFCKAPSSHTELLILVPIS